MENLSKKIENFSLPIPWLHGTQFAFAYIAQEKGFFENEGLNVTLVENMGSEITGKAIGSGEYPIGIMSAEMAMIERSKGVPLTVVAVVDKINPSGITSHKKAKIRKPTDLYGKKVGVTLSSNTYQLFLAFLKKENLDRNKIIEVPISGTGQEWISGAVECHVLNPFLSEARAKIEELDVDNLLFYDYGLKIYGQVIVANSNFLEKNPEFIGRVTRALVKGLEYERANPEESLKIVFNKNPQINDDKKFHIEVFRRRLLLDQKLEDVATAGNGAQDKRIWDNTKDILEKLGMLEHNVNIGEFFTNKFISNISSNSTAPMVLLERVSKKYNQNKLDILRDVNFEINEGEFVSILGLSGCGKTTLLRIVGGLESDFQGKILINGQPISHINRENFGFVSQDSNLLPWKTVKENVLFFADISKKIVDPQTIINEVGLNGFENRFPNELSGGMKKRVSFARTLIMKPSLLFLDEPFGGLDKFTQWSMSELIMRLCKEHLITTLMVTHDIDEAILLSDKVIVLKGRPAVVKSIYKILFTRPRDRNMRYLPEYSRITKEIYDDFNL